ncbi:MAG TPA: DUF4199 domain-containing protein [Longimicrobiales bacterium]|nr:DUF4199 domain-containing protein [Longimicrobiales bacterium]
MSRTIWTYGIIAGAIMSAMMLVTFPLIDRIGFETAEVIGYTTIIAAFLLIFFGVRSYRDQTAAGALSFRRALMVGLLINLVASACYVATWQVIYYRLAPDFGDKYAAWTIEKERAAGASDQQIAASTARIQEFQELYRNPIVNIAVTFLEPFSIGLIVALVAAAILRTSRTPLAPGGGRTRGDGGARYTS